MERHERQNRTHARAVGAGIAVSVAVHAAAFALVSFSVPAFDTAQEVRVADEPEAVPAVTEPVMQVVALREIPAVEAAEPASAVAVQAEAPAAAAAAVAVADVVEAPAAALPSVEPDAAPGGAVLPGEPTEAVAVAEEALEPTPAQAGEEEEEEHALPAGVVMHVPGAVGRAKGQWGAAGGNGDEERRGRGPVIRVTKCPPLPGRGRPPIMRPPVNHHLVHPAGW